MNVSEIHETYLAWLKNAQATGALPQNTQRVIIDIPLDGLPRVLVISHAHKDLANDGLLRMVAACEPVPFSPKPKEEVADDG